MTSNHHITRKTITTTMTTAARLLSVVVLLTLCSLAAIAQGTVSVKSFTKTSDPLQGDDRRRDANDAYCALVKVQVLDDIERVESGSIGDILNRGTEKWIYMLRGSSRMKIHFKNHLPITVVFKNYKIARLESNRVYELVLNVSDPGASQRDEPEVIGNDLKIRVSPANATVAVWGENMQRKTYRPNEDGTITIPLPYGRYNYLAVAKGYNDAEGSVFVDDADKWENVSLAPIEGTLLISCPTKNTEFYLNGEPVTKAINSREWIGSMKPGHYTLEIRREGYVSQSRSVDIVANETTEAVFSELITLKEQHAAERARVKAEEKQRRQEEELQAKQLEDQRGEIRVTANNSYMPSATNNLNETFKYTYGGASFKCKARNGIVTITDVSDINTNTISIPSTVQYNGVTCPVVEVVLNSSGVFGNPYKRVKKLIVEEGIKQIGKTCFQDFNKLEYISIPTTISYIGKYAFNEDVMRNPNLILRFPKSINEADLREGRSIGYEE